MSDYLPHLRTLIAWTAGACLSVTAMAILCAWVQLNWAALCWLFGWKKEQ